MARDGIAKLRDVARLAGVSTPTASKALNGREDVNSETRGRVLEAAERLAYAPNAAARSLFKGRSGIVGVLTSDLEGRFVIPILMGAEDAFGAGQMSVILCDARGDKIREQHQLRTLLARRIDGLIVVGRQIDPRPSLGRDLPLPVVYAYAPSEDPADLSLVPDNEQVGRLAGEHLIVCGRRRIAHISGEADHSSTKDRARGLLSTLNAAGLELVGGAPMLGDWSEGWGRAAASLLMAQNLELDAIACGSDQIARGVMDVLRDRGRAIPNDVAVIGVDNWVALAANARPSLTTIDLNLEHLGRTGALRIFAALDQDKPAAGGVERLPCRLVLRESSVPSA